MFLNISAKFWRNSRPARRAAGVPRRPAAGSVIEANVKKGLGVTATTLIEKGTLRVGDVFCAGAAWGKCRALLDERGDALDEAGPSTPAQLVGWATGADRAPLAGDRLQVVPDEQTARKLSEARHELATQKRDAKLRAATQGAFAAHLLGLGGEGIKEERSFPVVVKADSMGAVEALTSSLEGLDVQDDVSRVKANVVFGGVGDVTKSDVAVASVAGASVPPSGDFAPLVLMVATCFKRTAPALRRCTNQSKRCSRGRETRCAGTSWRSTSGRTARRWTRSGGSRAR